MDNLKYMTSFIIVILLVGFLTGAESTKSCSSCSICCGLCDEHDWDDDGNCDVEDPPCGGDGCAGCGDGYRCKATTLHADVSSWWWAWPGLGWLVRAFKFGNDRDYFECVPAEKQEICGDRIDNDCARNEKYEDAASEDFDIEEECGYNKYGEVSCCDDDGDGSYDRSFKCEAPYSCDDAQDNNPDVYPGAPESCDNVDNDQNGVFNTDNTGAVMTESCQINATTSGTSKCIAPMINPNTGGFWSDCEP